MPTIVWLVAGVGAWLAALYAICALLTAAKRADARLQTPPSVLVDLAPGGPPVNDASGRLEPRVSAIVVGVREPRLAGGAIAIAAGGQANPPLAPPVPSADVDPARPPHAYPLYVRGEPVAHLCWRVRPGWAPGWYVWQRRGGWRRLAVDPDFDASCGMGAQHPGLQEAADLAASVNTALALDAAANLLHGPPTPASRPLRNGRYEVHASGLPADAVPIAFPETITVRAGDVSTLAGHFDDRGLAILTRRIAILGGRLLALFHADRPHAEHAPP